MARSYKKEAEWARKVYKQFFFKCRTDNGELERLQAVLDGRPFADWVREKLAEDEVKNKPLPLNTMGYEPVCPRGYIDCVCDPAYIKFHHPEWYAEMYGDKTPYEAAEGCRQKVADDPDEEFFCYDDEDK